MNLQDKYVLSTIGDEDVACSVGNGKPRAVVLNESGEVLWHLLEKGATEEELSAALCDKFDITKERAQSDAAAFVENLKSHGVL